MLVLNVAVVTGTGQEEQYRTCLVHT